MRPIYLDYMSTTPIDYRVRQAMLPYLSGIENDLFGNPTTNNYYGNKVKIAIEESRAQIADLINCDPKELIWTSGATEGNNLSIKGIAFSYKKQGKHIITTKIEHKSVIDSCRYLEINGFDITYISPNKDGIINVDDIENNIRKDTILISTIHVNNEIGIVQNIKKIGELAKKYGILYHVDAAQSIGKIEINLKELKIDVMTFSSHKVYGPKGIGALYVRKKPRIRLIPLLHGGKQENNLRSGTLATHQIIGMGMAFYLIKKEFKNEINYISFLKKRLLDGLSDLSDFYINGSVTSGVAGNLNISFGNITEGLLINKLTKITVSHASSCTEIIGDSHVLKALGISRKLATNTIRISIGRFTTIEEIDNTIKHIKDVVTELRQ